MRTKNKVIALDVDGVICDFLLGFTTAANQMDSSLPIMSDGQASEWNLEPWYCDKKTLSRIWKYIRDNRPFFWTELEPLVGSDIFCKLVYAPVDVYFITARVEIGYITAQRQTVAWLRRIFNQYNQGYHGFIPQVICSNRKMEVCDVLNVAYYLDDKPDNLLGFGEIGTKGYLLYKPYMKERVVLSTPNPDTTGSPFYLHEGCATPVVYSVDKFLGEAGL